MPVEWCNISTSSHSDSSIWKTIYRFSIFLMALLWNSKRSVMQYWIEQYIRLVYFLLRNACYFFVPRNEPCVFCLVLFFFLFVFVDFFFYIFYFCSRRSFARSFVWVVMFYLIRAEGLFSLLLCSHFFLPVQSNINVMTMDIDNGKSWTITVTMMVTNEN